MQTSCTVTSKACKCLLTSWRRTRPTRHAAGPLGLSGNYQHPGSPPGKWKGLGQKPSPLEVALLLFGLCVLCHEMLKHLIFGAVQGSGDQRNSQERDDKLIWASHSHFFFSSHMNYNSTRSVTVTHFQFHMFAHIICLFLSRLLDCIFWRRGRGFDNLTSLISLSFFQPQVSGLMERACWLVAGRVLALVRESCVTSLERVLEQLYTSELSLRSITNRTGCLLQYGV